MSLEERTLVVRCTHHMFDERITRDLLNELFLQSGPVKNVVLRPDHAFIEFNDKCSVGYALALMEGTSLYGQPLVLSPKIESQETYKYVTVMENFNNAMQRNPQYFYQYLSKDTRSTTMRTTHHSNDLRNYRESDKIKYSSYSDLNRSYPSYSDNRPQRDYDRRHSYTNSHHNRYSHYPQQQQHNRSFSNNSYH